MRRYVSYNKPTRVVGPLSVLTGPKPRASAGQTRVTLYTQIIEYLKRSTKQTNVKEKQLLRQQLYGTRTIINI